MLWENALLGEQKEENKGTETEEEKGPESRCEPGECLASEVGKEEFQKVKDQQHQSLCRRWD